MPGEGISQICGQSDPGLQKSSDQDLSPDQPRPPPPETNMQDPTSENQHPGNGKQAIERPRTLKLGNHKRKFKNREIHQFRGQNMPSPPETTNQKYLATYSGNPA